MVNSVGKKLQQARFAKQLSIEEASRVTRIRPDKLLDLEEDNYSNFPSMSYAKGFLLLYARYLGIDVRDYAETLHSPNPVSSDDYEYLNAASEAPPPPPTRRPYHFAPKREHTILPVLVFAFLTGAVVLGIYLVVTYQRLGNLEDIAEKKDFSSPATSPAITVLPATAVATPPPVQAVTVLPGTRVLQAIPVTTPPPTVAVASPTPVPIVAPPAAATPPPTAEAVPAATPEQTPPPTLAAIPTAEPVATPEETPAPTTEAVPVATPEPTPPVTAQQIPTGIAVPAPSAPPGGFQTPPAAVPSGTFDPNREVRRAEPVIPPPPDHAALAPADLPPVGASPLGLAAIAPAATPIATPTPADAPDPVKHVSILPIRRTLVTIRKDVPGSPPIFENWVYPGAGPLRLSGRRFWIEVQDPGAVQITQDGQPLPAGQAAVHIE
jgi:cytoskeletal protein RodZ